MASRYVFFYLEIALRDPKDLNIYAFENISHVPTKKLVEIFKINLSKDPHILEGYFLTKAAYRKHKSYLMQTIGQLNLDIFEYTLRQYAGSDATVRKLYKKSLME
jgi:hypothetical protein